MLNANLWPIINKLEQLQDSNKRSSGIGFMDEVGKFVSELDGMLDALREAQIEIEAADQQREWNWNLERDIEMEARKLA